MSERRVRHPAGMPDLPGWSHGVTAGGWVFGSGTLATDHATGLVPQARPDPGSLGV